MKPYVILKTDKLAESVQFYTDVLRFEQSWEWRDDATGLRTVGVFRGDMAFILDEVAAGAARPEGGPLIFIDLVDLDVDAFFATVRDRAEVLSPPADKPWGDRVFTIKDPAGYVLSLLRTLT